MGGLKDAFDYWRKGGVAIQEHVTEQNHRKALIEQGVNPDAPGLVDQFLAGGLYTPSPQGRGGAGGALDAFTQGALAVAAAEDKAAQAKNRPPSSFQLWSSGALGVAMAKQEAEQQPRSVSPLNFGAAFRAFGQGAVATLEAQRAAVQAERPPSLLRTHAQAFASGVAADLDAKEREWKAQQPIGTARTAGRMVAGASKAYALRGLNHVLGTPDRWATNRAERKAIDKAEGLNKRVQAHKDDLENQAQEAGIGRAQRANQFTQDMQDFVQEREESRQARATYGAHQQADWASQQDSQRAGNQTRYGLHFAETGGGDYYSDTREGQQVRAQAEDYMNQRMNSTQSGPLIIEGEVAE